MHSVAAGLGSGEGTCREPAPVLGATTAAVTKMFPKLSRWGRKGMIGLREQSLVHQGQFSEARAQAPPLANLGRKVTHGFLSAANVQTRPPGLPALWPGHRSCGFLFVYLDPEITGTILIESDFTAVVINAQEPS